MARAGTIMWRARSSSSSSSASSASSGDDRGDDNGGVAVPPGAYEGRADVFVAGEATIPRAATVIGARAFKGCRALADVRLPRGIAEVDAASTIHGGKIGAAEEESCVRCRLLARRWCGLPRQRHAGSRLPPGQESRQSLLQC